MLLFFSTHVIAMKLRINETSLNSDGKSRRAVEAAAFKFTELSFFISKLSTITLTCNMRTQVSEVPNQLGRGSLGVNLFS